jgi:hypothetical protein
VLSADDPVASKESWRLKDLFIMCGGADCLLGEQDAYFQQGGLCFFHAEPSGIRKSCSKFQFTRVAPLVTVAVTFA